MIHGGCMSELGAASATDLTAIRGLLDGCGLPTGDLESARPEFVVIREDDLIVAAGALQRFGRTALLRSVVVSPGRRRSGLGRRVVVELERLARAAGIDQVILLTESALGFFARQGYRIIERSAAPEDMQHSEEFGSLCPSSATCMAKRVAE
jgi:amino-acid N-acetyltransferase